MLNKKGKSYYFCWCFFLAFVIFLYGPTFTIVVLSFQGPEGGLTFPMNGFSFHWFHKLWEGGGYVDIGSAFRRSILLGLILMVLTVLLSVSAGMAFRKKFFGANFLFLITVSSLIVPSIILSLGIALEFRLLDETLKFLGDKYSIQWIINDFQTTLNMYSSGLGAQLTWTLPFGLLIMFAIFNRFDKSFEEASMDLGASSWQTFKFVVLPIIAPSVIGIALFGFTLSYDELARSSQVMGATNTLPLELKGLTTTVTTPVIYALGTLTTGISFLAIFIAIILFMIIRYRIFGLIADFAIIFNIILLISLLSLIEATLTMPGIAGIVLTVGMAVDANVLVFERIKEELRSGRSIINSIDLGYKFALKTILDANFTTLIAALLLYNYGSGPIKGFAVTLSIGIITSMFTALILTKLIVTLWVVKLKPNRLFLTKAS